MLGLRTLTIPILLGGAAAAWAHGPTQCLGTANYSAGNSVSLDLRFGVGVLHKYVDSNDDALVSGEEWTSASATLHKLFGAGIRLRSEETVTTPSSLTLNLTSGSEIQVLATVDIATTAPMVNIALPVLRKFPGAPPAQMSVWTGKTMAHAPEMLWFDKELSFDRTALPR